MALHLFQAFGVELEYMIVDRDTLAIKSIADELIKSEFALNNLRIDTLAYDNENSSFVIIEYKRDRNFSVIDQ